MQKFNQRESRFLAMLKTQRPDNSPGHWSFCQKYLKPVFGPSDAFGNYTLTVGPEKPRIMFASHSDTVHTKDGMQKLSIDQNRMIGLHSKSLSNCLGADCTTGVHIILEMIRAGIPGMYAIFAAEEIGCLGSKDFVKHRKADIAGIDFVISLDRKGTDSIITHQCSQRTASDSFAFDLARILNMEFKADSNGVFTDSNEFRAVVSECTNLSVGYFRQHTKSETQDLAFLERLTDSMINADWSQLKAYRDCTITEYESDPFGDNWPGSYRATKSAKIYSYEDWAGFEPTMRDLVRDYPNAVADWLEDQGMNADDLANQLGISNGARDSAYGN